MKYALAVLLTLLWAAGAAADIGPSPNFSFSIANADEYPGYTFYYAGNIWPDQLEQVTGNTSVYKLNTHIRIYAVPDDVAQGQETIEPAPEESIVSQQIDLSAGYTVLRINALDEGSGQMSVSTGRYAPETTDPLGGTTIAIVVVVVVVVAIGIFLKSRAKNELLFR